MTYFLSLIILGLILSSAAMADEACDVVLGLAHNSAIIELVKGYKALEKAEVEGQPKAARSSVLKALNKRKDELESIYGKEKFAKFFTDIKNKISVPDNSNLISRQHALIEEARLLGRWWRWEEGKALDGNYTFHSDVKFSPDEKLILGCASENKPAEMKAIVWDANTGHVLKVIDVGALDRSNSNICYNLDFSLDSRYIIKVLNDTVIVWDAYSGEQINPVPAHLKPTPFDAKQMSPDGQSIFRFDEKRKQVFLLNLVTGEETVLDTHPQPTMGVRAKFSPDGLYIYVSYFYDSADKDLPLYAGIWDAVTGRFIGKVDQSYVPSAVTFSEDSELILSVANKSIKIWNVADGSFVKEIQYPAPVTAKSINLGNVLITPDKKTIVVGMDGRFEKELVSHILIFDFETGELIQELTPGHQRQNVHDGIRSLHLNRKLDRLISAYFSSVVIWKAVMPDVSETD